MNGKQERNSLELDARYPEVVWLPPHYDLRVASQRGYEQDIMIANLVQNSDTREVT